MLNRSLAFLASAAVFLGSGVAIADEEITVIGTRAAPRTEVNSPVPVDVLSAEELQSTGAVAGELGQALATLAPSFNFPRQSNSGTSDHIRAGQLRGLSPDQMLVLVNGHRRHTSAVVNSETKIGRGTAAVDFNYLPLSAISRVEVLRDGAGSLYGSDAIAGVINVVLDDSAGFETNLSWGTHDTDYSPIDESLDDGETLTFDAKYGWALGDGFAKVGASFKTRDGTNRAGFDLVPFFEAQTADNLATAGERNYAEGDPEVDEFVLWFNSELAVGEIELYGFGTAGNRDSEGGGAFFRYPDSPANVKSIYPDGYRPETRGDDTDYALTVGARSSLAGWEADGSLSYGENEFEFGIDRSLNPSLGEASPTSFDSGTYNVNQLIIAGDLRRDFDVSWLAGSLSVAVGGEFRREEYETQAGQLESYTAGPNDFCPAESLSPEDEAAFFDAWGGYFCFIGAQAAPGLTPADEVSIDRDVGSIFVDLGLQVSDAWFVEVGARFEDYDDFGTALTGKLATRYAFTDAIGLRGSVSNSFRAPNIAQVGFSDTTLNFGEGRSLIRTRTLRVDSAEAQAFGAEELDEEQSFNVSTGITFDFDAVRLTIDAFLVDVDDRITLSERLFGDAVEAVLDTFPGSEDIQSVRFFTNAVDTRTRGVDAVLTWAFDAMGGDASLSAGYNYSRTSIEEARVTNPTLEAIDDELLLVGVEEANTLETAAPRSKLILTGTWAGENLDLLARYSHYDSTTRVFNFGGGFEPSQTYGPENQLDLEASYAFNDNLHLTLGVQNLTDNYPDLSSDLINYFDNLPYDILSPIGVNGRYFYVSTRFTF
ncbi:MAG: TonB-dependent receptor [Gammaproteobacteria bacterium]|nr:TonB-dependent receptor [Gammaproteobacteria bacterium]